MNTISSPDGARSEVETPVGDEILSWKSPDECFNLLFQALENITSVRDDQVRNKKMKDRQLLWARRVLTYLARRRCAIIDSGPLSPKVVAEKLNCSTASIGAHITYIEQKLAVTDLRWLDEIWEELKRLHAKRYAPRD